MQTLVFLPPAPAKKFQHHQLLIKFKNELKFSFIFQSERAAFVLQYIHRILYLKALTVPVAYKYLVFHQFRFFCQMRTQDKHCQS